MKRKLYTAEQNVLIIYYWLNLIIIIIFIFLGIVMLDNMLETNKTGFKPSIKLKHNVHSGSLLATTITFVGHY